MEVTYTKQGDYLLPDLKLEQTETTIGKYGLLRKSFLMEHKKGLYSSLLLTGKLEAHLAEIDQTARERIHQITMDLVQASPAPDKAIDQMGWIGYMNSLKHQAEETVYTELIYN